MANFGQKPRKNLKTLWKNLNFSTFSTFCFYSLEKRCFVLEYHKTHFPGLDYLIKKKMNQRKTIVNSWVRCLENSEIGKKYCSCNN